MPGAAGGLFFGGTDLIEPSGKDDSILNGYAASTYPGEESDADEDVPYENPQTGERSLKRAASPTANGAPASKKVRVPGGKAAVPKRIVADYDSDDGRIISLKQQGYSDEYVASKLIQEGRIRYVPKTVGSRWLRLRKALEQAENEKLDDELSDWHVGEDDLLATSFQQIDEKFEKEMEKVINRKWKEISANLAERLRKKKYTAKACRERYEGVQAGTALLPIEIDQDKEGRRLLRETRIAEAKQRRADQAAEAQRADEDKKRRIEEKKLEADEREKNRILKVREKEEVKAEEERIKKEKQDDKVRRRAAKLAAIEQAKAEEEWQKTMRRTEAELYKKMTGKKMPGAPGAPRKAGGGRRSHKDDFLDDDDEEDAMTLNDDDEAEMSSDESEDSELDDSHLFQGSSSISNTPTPVKATKKPTVTTKPKVTKETLLNPRSIMTDAELDVLLFERGLARRTTRESHPQVVARLAAADQDLSTTELNNPLMKYFDKGRGSKEAKVKRLQEHDAASSAAGGNGVKATDLEFKQGYEGYKGEYRSFLGA